MDILVAESFWRRLAGLAWRRQPHAEHALLIPRCASVHTFGMRYRIDVAFLGEGDVVLAVYEDVGARRVLSQKGAVSVLEAPAGRLDEALRLLLQERAA